MRKQSESVNVRSSLFAKLIGVFFLTNAILFGVTYAYFHSTISATETQVQKQNEILVQSMAASIGSLQELNSAPTESQYEKLFEPLSINKRIVSYALINRNGVIVYAKDPTKVNTVVDSRQGLSRSQQKNLSSVQYVDNQARPVTDIITPVFQRSSAQQSLQIVFSNQELVDLQRRDYQVFGVIAVSMLVMSGLTLFYLSRLIRQPLSEVMRGVAAVSNNRFDYRIVVHRHDEIGRLASAFNNMAISLQESRKRLSRERALLEEAKAELVASVSSLPFGFALIGRELDILYSNEELGSIIGQQIPTNPQQSRLFLKRLDKEYSKDFKFISSIEQVFEKGQPIELSVPAGTQFLRIVLTPVQVDKRVIGAVLIIEDITEAKVLERSRDEFFSIASHELRTPLTTIRGNTSLVLEYYRDQIKDSPLDQMVDDIHNSSVRLIAIVNDFLDVSRLEQGRMVFKNEPMNITPLIEDSVNQYNAAELLHGLKLEFDSPGPCWVIADSDRARQVITNLISNAIKYTDTGTVSIRVEVNAKKVRILVTDSGKGIPKESQHLLFHKFQQASNNILTRDNSQSTGLGLYIASLIARGMKGKVGLLSSELNKGSTFYLELPRSQTIAKPAKKPKKQP